MGAGQHLHACTELEELRWRKRVGGGGGGDGDDDNDARKRGEGWW